MSSIETSANEFVGENYKDEKIKSDVLSRVLQDPHAARRRSIAKAVSWRLFGSIDTFLVATVVSGHAHTGALIAGFEIATKLLLYYLHERGWARIRWGLK